MIRQQTPKRFTGFWILFYQTGTHVLTDEFWPEGSSPPGQNWYPFIKVYGPTKEQATAKIKGKTPILIL